MLGTGHLLITSEEEDGILTTLSKIHMEIQIFFKIYCFKMSTTVLTSPKFTLMEGYEVTTSPQKPELSPFLNRGIPLIN